jgi:Rps23 Pro-64 3,4-dihydroxylase Tpa1-like proline 4-hydroxylase
LFDGKVLDQYIEEYAKSQPYKHAVIRELMDDSLLRNVRSEIRENVHFTPKETDIYKIHQSGDLANLDGLDDAALSKLPSLLRLRDALYSRTFRNYVAAITNSGELSGRKTDMAINIYTPGCHLLCHDDVIGSRKVSYILYLTDPDIPWQEEWGGALRLYPTTTVKGEDGEVTKIPSPDFNKVIPPAWNQLSFFAVQPGESFHDVEEVYHADNKEQLENEGARIRMAISGWFHIPQIGEDGYIEGAEEKLAEKSSLVQLQGRANRSDFPQELEIAVESLSKGFEDIELDAADIDFLLKYMSPTYLTPDTMQQVADHFTEQSSVTLDGLLSKKFSERLREYLQKQEAILSLASKGEMEKEGWKVARPPHKHRFLYLQSSPAQNGSPQELAANISPIQELLHAFLPSSQFRQWLELATQCEIESYNVMARRFRHGLDYALATSHEGKPRLEINLGVTPTSGWSNDKADEDDEGEEDATDDILAKPNGKERANGKAKALEKEEEIEDVGGHEIYMAGDEVDGDAAVYKSTTGDDDDNVLFTMPATWNKMSIVLRDSGVLKFVKYVSKTAKGDRWDICGVYGVKEEEEGENDDEDGGRDRAGGKGNIENPNEYSQSQITLPSSDEEEEFNGFPESEDTDSDY